MRPVGAKMEVVGTGEVTILTVPVSKLWVVEIGVANLHNAAITFEIVITDPDDAGAEHYLAKSAPLNVGDSIIVRRQLPLKTGSEVRATCSQALGMDVVVSPFEFDDA